MMATLQQYGLTRGKLAVIVSLCLMLGSVWGNALSGGGSKRSTVKRTNARPARQAAVQAAETASGAESTRNVSRERIELPPADVERVAGKDPFARPHWAEDRSVASGNAAPSLSEREALLEQLRKQGVSMVVLSGGKKIAQVGDRQIRTGDYLSGFRVIDITAAGVVLSEEPLQDGS